MMENTHTDIMDLKQSLLTKNPKKNIAEALDSHMTSQMQIDRALVGTANISVSRMVYAEGELQARDIDEDFVDYLTAMMESSPTANYLPWTVMCTSDASKEQIITSPNSYTYMVLGGNHSLMATNKCIEAHPNINSFHVRNCQIFTIMDHDLAVEV